MKLNSFLSKFWFRMSPIERLIFIIVVAILLYMAYKYFKSRLQTASDAVEHKGEIDALKAAGQKASYPDSTYESLANQLFKAMDGGGTTEAVIPEVFKKLKNDIDFVKLDGAFGLRAGTSWFAESTPTDLRNWLESDGVDLTALNAQLRRQNITKRF